LIVSGAAVIGCASIVTSGVSGHIKAPSEKNWTISNNRWYRSIRRSL